MFRHKSKHSRATIYAMVTFASIHLAISLLAAIYNNQPDLANMFHVLGIDLLFPSLGKGPLSAFLGAVFILSLWYIVSKIIEYHDRKLENEKNK